MVVTEESRIHLRGRAAVERSNGTATRDSSRGLPYDFAVKSQFTDTLYAYFTENSALQVTTVTSAFRLRKN